MLGAIANSIVSAGGGEKDVTAFELGMLTVLLVLLAVALLALLSALAMPRKVDPAP